MIARVFGWFEPPLDLLSRAQISTLAVHNERTRSQALRAERAYLR